MRYELAIVVLALSVLYVALLDVAERGRGGPTARERRAMLRYAGGGVLISGGALLALAWVTDQVHLALAASDGWMPAVALVQVIRSLSGG